MRFRRYRFSKRYEKLRSELAEMLRLSAATRKREHGEVCNWLLGHAGHIIVEDNSYKAFQRGRFGKTIGRHAPAALYAQLTNKAESAGLLVEVVSPKKLKPSQHNLLTDTFSSTNFGSAAYDWVKMTTTVGSTAMRRLV